MRVAPDAVHVFPPAPNSAERSAGLPPRSAVLAEFRAEPRALATTVRLQQAHDDAAPTSPRRCGSNKPSRHHHFLLCDHRPTRTSVTCNSGCPPKRLRSVRLSVVLTNCDTHTRLTQREFVIATGHHPRSRTNRASP